MPVESKSLPEIHDPVLDAKGGISGLKNVATMSKTLEELAREDARVQGQSPLAKRRTVDTSDESGPLPLVPKFRNAWFLDDDTTVCAC